MSIAFLKWKINWKRLFCLIGIILVIVLLLLWISGAWKPATPGVKEMKELLTIKKALENYHQEYLRYPQSYEMPSSIGEFLPKVPRPAKGKSYNWMDNTNDEQKFCIWVEWPKYNMYFLVSPCGAKTVYRQPFSLEDCCELTKP